MALFGDRPAKATEPATQRLCAFVATSGVSQHSLHTHPCGCLSREVRLSRELQLLLLLLRVLFPASLPSHLDFCSCCLCYCGLILGPYPASSPPSKPSEALFCRGGSTRPQSSLSSTSTHPLAGIDPSIHPREPSSARPGLPKPIVWSPSRLISICASTSVLTLAWDGLAPRAAAAPATFFPGKPSQASPLRPVSTIALLPFGAFASGHGWRALACPPGRHFQLGPAPPVASLAFDRNKTNLLRLDAHYASRLLPQSLSSPSNSCDFDPAPLTKPDLAASGHV